MGAGKSATLINTHFMLCNANKKVAVLKPCIDTRNGKGLIKSRNGQTLSCTSIKKDCNIENIIADEIDIVIVDEAQFLTEEQVNQLYRLSKGIDVYCYGLLTDFKTELFEGSKRLIELADELEHIKSLCKCGNIANRNARIDSKGKVIKDGQQILIGADETYQGCCNWCYDKGKVKI